jgi:antitoxin (DNA-binding transcriptional repressor) of toxin-antitoxin stability system
MQVSLQYAQEHFADIVSAANRGEDVEIAQADKPALKLFLLPSHEQPGITVQKPKRVLGAWEGLVVLPTDEEWQAMDKEIEDEMLNGPFFPPAYR